MSKRRPFINIETNSFTHPIIAISVGLAGYIINDRDPLMFLLFFIMAAILIEITNIRMQLAEKLK